jgi:DNA polymerase V
MGDVARCSVYQEDLLYKLFGKNAELLIDHAWGYEPCTIAEIKAYRPENTSLSVGQVLSQAYDFKKARLVIQEMAESLTLDLVRKKLVTNQMVLTVGYDRKSIETGYSGKITSDAYGRQIPAHAHGTQNLNRYTSSSKAIVGAVLELFDRIADPSLYVRRMYVVANHTEYEDKIACQCEQLSLFSAEEAADEGALKKEREIQQTVLKLQERYGKNAVLKGMNFKQGATAVERNGQIGGHRA